jgi:hypothetical protein
MMAACGGASIIGMYRTVREIGALHFDILRLSDGEAIEISAMKKSQRVRLPCRFRPKLWRG